MAIAGSRQLRVRLAALAMIAVLVGSAVFTYLSFVAAFTPTDTITVSAPRAGLVMEKDAKVKYRGVQVGQVKSIDYVGDQAQLTLAVKRGQMSYIPSNAVIRIAGNTIFGAKAVEFIPPEEPSTTPIRPGAHVAASSVQLEVNTLFQTLTDVLHKIDPIALNATITALAEGLRGHGDDVGALLAGVNELSEQVIPKLPTLKSDFAKAAVVGGIFADSGPDLVRLLDNVPSISDTLVDQKDNLNATLLATIGLASDGYETLAPAEDDFIAAIQRLRAPIKVLADYSPEFGCLFKAITDGVQKFGPLIGVTRPGLFLSNNFILGAPSYTYPESLPIVNASGGPNCRGLPDLPTKQNGGSWYRPRFLVTDNAYIPYEPFTEMQVDAPSTFQFLFNGVYAERDEF